MPTWRSDASASHTPSRQSLLDEKSVSSRSGTFWFSSSAHLVVDSSGSLPLLSLPHSAVRNFCTDGFFAQRRKVVEYRKNDEERSERMKGKKNKRERSAQMQRARRGHPDSRRAAEAFHHRVEQGNRRLKTARMEPEERRP